MRPNSVNIYSGIESFLKIQHYGLPSLKVMIQPLLRMFLSLLNDGQYLSAKFTSFVS